jgi:hypothetical protein
MKSIYSARFRSLLRSFGMAAAAIVFLNACSVLVGHVMPEEEKSPKVPFTDVTLISPEWKHLDIPGRARNSEDIPDAAWQSSVSAAVISLNSACRQNSDEAVDLKEVTQVLLSQWDHLTVLSETPKKVSGFPALETEAEGRYLDRNRKFKTVVVKTSTCVYDLVYLSPVKTFEQELSIFERFRDSLNLK